MDILTPPSIFAEFNHRELAEKMGVHRDTIYKWRRRAKIPADRVAIVSHLTGIPRERLRPDLYGWQIPGELVK